ncbi:MAG: hypothetical protein ACSLEL_02205 [Candidatus Malihini olakiniferum]
MRSTSGFVGNLQCRIVDEDDLEHGLEIESLEHRFRLAVVSAEHSELYYLLAT